MTLDLLLIGLALGLEPLPISAHILVLASEGGTRKGVAFVLGWVLTLVVIVVVAVAVTGGKPPAPRSVPSDASLVVRILLGAALLVFAWRKRSQRGRPPAEPRWMKGLDRLNFWGALALGFFLQPWTLVAAGAATVLETDLSKPATVLTLIAYCLLGSSSYLVMQGYVLLSPEAAHARLSGLNAWISTHRDQMIVWLCVVVGLWLVTVNSYRLAR